MNSRVYPQELFRITLDGDDRNINKKIDMEITRCSECPFYDGQVATVRDLDGVISCEIIECIYGGKKQQDIKTGWKFPKTCPLKSVVSQQAHREKVLEAFAEEMWEIFHEREKVREDVFKQAIKEALKSGDFLSFCTYIAPGVDRPLPTAIYKPYAGIENLKQKVRILEDENARLKEAKEEYPIFGKR